MPPKRRYEEIAAHYRRLIQDGELSPGDRLPSLRNVCDEFSVAVATANRAFQMLKTEGLTDATSEGTVVAEQPNVAVTGVARLRRLKRTGKSLAPGETTTNRWAGLLSVADPEIAKLLGLEPHDEVVMRRRVHRRDGRPPTLELSCIHMRALIDVPELRQPEPFKRLWHEVYTERTGREVTKSPERRTARLISNDELNALGITLPPESAAAVLVVVNVFHDEAGAIEYWEDVYPPGAWQADTE
jgi:DNA-binding GntR family transcriptional regulator